MIDLYGVLQEQETINGELGLGVDYYKGEKGDTPIKGVDYLTPDDVKEISDKVLEKVEAGTKGEDGKSAYQIALDEGFEGSETEWLASLKGADGRNGIDGINGTNGKDGTNGINGKTPVKGVDYFTQAEIQQIENNAAAKVDLSDYTKSADLSSVATSGSYNDLKDKPSIPAAYELPVASATALGGVKVGSGLSITDGVLSATGGGIADSVDWSKIQNKPNFANVATSGDYNDLSNKPTIPSVEGLASEAYVNEKVAAIVIPEVPTKVSELENDKGYLTEHQSLEGYAKTADLAQVAKTGSYNDLIDKPTIPSTTGLATETYVDDKIAEIDIPTVPTKVSAFTNDAGYLTEHQSLIEYAKKTDIPAPYTLPTASTSTLGGVKVDGNTITIADGVISSVGGSGVSEPEKYIKDASVSGNTLTLTKRDDTEVVFTPSGGGSSAVQGYAFTFGKTLTSEDKAHILEIQSNPLIPMYINGSLVSKIYTGGNYIQFRVIEIKGVGNDCFSVYSVNYNQSGITSNELNLQMQWYIASSNATINGELITSYNLKDQIKQNAGWSYTTDSSESDLYNAKEMVLIGINAVNENFQQYYNFSYERNQNEACLGSDYQNITYTITASNSSNITWYYNGSSIDTSAVIQLILYKT